MKKILILLSLIIVAASATATGVGKTTKRKAAKTSQTVKSKTAAGNNADKIFESIKSQYSRKQISADSVVSLALYHKQAMPKAAERALLLAAESGNPRAMMELGNLYTFHRDYKSTKKADGVALLQKARAAGMKDANAYLGKYYYQSDDKATARKYMEAALPSTLGFVYSTIGEMLDKGQGGYKKDFVKARENYRQAALLGDAIGADKYGHCLGQNRYGGVDYPASFFWLYISGDLGENAARMELFLPRVKKEYDNEAIARLNEAADKMVEDWHKGQSITDQPVYREGFLAGAREEQNKAEHGNPWACYYLGSMFYNGDFLNQNYAYAINFLEPITVHDRLPAPLLANVYQRLADMYSNGKGTKADKAKAEKYLRSAAKYGSQTAYKTVERIN